MSGTRVGSAGAGLGLPGRLNGTAESVSGMPTEIVLFDGADRVIGRLTFRVCRECRTGRILDIWIDETWQREGLGRELVRGLLARHPGHAWTTTSQTRQGQAFFTAMSRETGLSLAPGGPLCPHLVGRLRRLLTRVPRQRSPGDD
ncbi:GNAT family N-acetyltransferase [Streptomyces sp. CC219B]|uniref:GNAT family N-acetyltransferase n=1 Tax=Streptomyces sp. CC219B TaxID=3044574 RepID=UPI0024A8C02B|nr:GNAT family N-acetyltransferase [Streptomyces sp. CC219B]